MVQSFFVSKKYRFLVDTLPVKKSIVNVCDGILSHLGSGYNLQRFNEAPSTYPTIFRHLKIVLYQLTLFTKIKLANLANFPSFDPNHIVQCTRQVGSIFYVIWIFFFHLILEVSEKLQINPNLHHHLCKPTKPIEKLKILVFLNQKHGFFGQNWFFVAIFC